MADNTVLPNGLNQWMQDELESREIRLTAEVERRRKELLDAEEALERVRTSKSCKHDLYTAGAFCEIETKCRHCTASWFH